MANFYSETEVRIFGLLEPTTVATQHLFDDEMKNVEVTIKKQRELIN